MPALRSLPAIIAATFIYATWSCNPEPAKTERDPYSSIKAGNVNDSLREVLRIAGQDTHRVKALTALSWQLRRENPDTAILLGEEAVKLAEEIRNDRMLAIAHNKVAVPYRLTAQYDQALEHNKRAVQLSEQINDSVILSSSQGNLGTIYYMQGNYPRALEYYLVAMKMGEAMHDTATVATQLTNLGALFIMQNEPDSSLKYYRLALSLDQVKDDMNGISYDLSGIAASHGKKENADSSLFYYMQAYKIEMEHGSTYGQERAIGNMGMCWAQRADHTTDDSLKTVYLDSAIACYRHAVALAHELHDFRGESLTMNNLARAWMDKEEYVVAEELLLAAAHLSDSMKILENMKDVELNLARLYDSLGNSKLAYQHYKNHILLRDSLVNDDKTNQLTRAQMNFEFEKQRAVEQAKTDEELARQRLLLNVSVGGGILLLIVAGISIGAYRTKKKSNEIISRQKLEVEKQKILVEVKQKEIIDSINYAQRIQSAILPAAEEIGNHFSDAFVFFRPKDIVSGDFYWMAKTRDFTFITAADCTGHGVPGGFMSMLGSSLLNEIVIEKQTTDTGEILDLLRLKIIRALKQKGESGEAKDGMDIVLCRFSNDYRKLVFSCANNPLWIVRNREVFEFKADKQPVGIGPVTALQQFATQQFDLEPGDCIYMFTDGYADQFGGPKGKKFKYKPLQEMLVKNHSRPMHEQLVILQQNFHDWQGQLEQVDDVLAIGIKV